MKHVFFELLLHLGFLLCHLGCRLSKCKSLVLTTKSGTIQSYREEEEVIDND